MMAQRSNIKKSSPGGCWWIHWAIWGCQGRRRGRSGRPTYCYPAWYLLHISSWLGEDVQGGNFNIYVLDALPQGSQIVQILQASLPNHGYPDDDVVKFIPVLTTAKLIYCKILSWWQEPVMGEVEDIEVVETGKHLTLDKAQLVPRQPVMVIRHNQKIFQRHCLNIIRSNSIVSITWAGSVW